MPNAYTEFVRREQTRRGWSNVQLADHAGLSKQVVGDVLNDTRDLLRQRPSPETVRGFADAFGVPEIALWQEIVKAMGIPLAHEATLLVELETATNAELLRELAKRLEEGGTGRVATDAEKSPGDGGAGDELKERRRKKKQDPLASGPPLPEEVAADETPGQESQYEQVTKPQDAAGEENQDPDEPDA